MRVAWRKLLISIGCVSDGVSDVQDHRHRKGSLAPRN